MAVNRFNGLEKLINKQYVFTMIVLLQALFGARGMIQTPQRLSNVFSSMPMRFAALFLIAYTATKEIEVALVGVFVFLVVLYAVRTKEEREKYGIL